MAEDEVEAVILEKNWKLESALKRLAEIPLSEFVQIANLSKLTELELHLFKLLNHVITTEHEIIFVKREALALFSERDELLDILAERLNEQFSRPIFDRLQEFA